MSMESRGNGWLLQPGVTVEDRLQFLEETIDGVGGNMGVGALNATVETQPNVMYFGDYRAAINRGIVEGRLAYRDGGTSLMSTTREQ